MSRKPPPPPPPDPLLGTRAPTRTATRAAEHPGHPAPPEYPSGPLDLATARAVARRRLADWQAQHE